ncbi:hypothetical protein NLJ89_g7572 [Agrocybe chaxingu]|uniref:pyranose dehydrogenase (acceptor) n=1 Tax=Agrocybe chaxingu TaxID=84603 RepID=A0A9W8JWJ3_9AGAR|nr:hypothetical protein NLJ89_g7572 [Agrocybe chaxingu]
MRPSTLLPFVLCALASPSFAAIYTKPWQLPRITYDYIIIGAGNAGNVLAHALSANSNTQVLVLEAGVSDENVLPAIAPFLGPTLTPNTPYDWNYTVAAQEGLDNRVFPYPRGRILGGCTTANYMVHHYGSSEDYDKLAAITGDNSLKWSNMKQYIQLHEKIVPPTDGHDTTGQYDPSLHSTSGQVSVSLPGNSQTIDAKVIATTEEFSEEFPFNQDITDGNVLGISWVQASIGNGVRSSSSTSYLRSANSRPNLHVLINATVQKVLQTGFKNGKPLFGGVLFQSSRHQFFPGFVLATKEVILSAGSINTPQILLLSGIGPRAELSALRIPTIINNPSVGKNLSDHVLLPTIFNVNGQESLDNILRGGAPLDAALNQWTTSKTGVIANTVTNNLGFLRIPNNATIFSTVGDPATGPTASHFELIFCNFWLNPGVAMPATGSFLTIIAALISPSSRGFVKLASDDPWDKPIIDPKMVTTAFDKFALREAVRSAKRFVTASAWDDYVIGPYGTTAGETDAELDTHVRQFSTTVFHPVGTASMSAPNSGWGVVDPNFKVKGAEGLRVVDASVWPHLPNAHTQGPTYLIAQRAAAVIKAGL